MLNFRGQTALYSSSTIPRRGFILRLLLGGYPTTSHSTAYGVSAGFGAQVRGVGLGGEAGYNLTSVFLSVTYLADLSYHSMQLGVFRRKVSIASVRGGRAVTNNAVTPVACALVSATTALVGRCNLPTTKRKTYGRPLLGIRRVLKV